MDKIKDEAEAMARHEAAEARAEQERLLKKCRACNPECDVGLECPTLARIAELRGRV